jgi:hypothetical protein
MNPDQAREKYRQLEARILASEAEMIAAGWRFLTVDGITVESEEDLRLLEQVLDAYDTAGAGIPERRHMSTHSRMTFGLRGPGAEAGIAALRARLDKLNPPSYWEGHRWEIRDGYR